MYFNKRYLETLSKKSPYLWIKDGNKLLNFSSNDYLALSGNNDINKKAVESLFKYGLGANSSRLISGNLSCHADCEKEISSWLGYQNSLILSSGFAANVSLISSLASSKDLIIFDKLSHASIVDGIKLSNAKWYRYNHNDMHHLKEILVKNVGKYDNIFVITESIFSMDGDSVDFSLLKKLKNSFNFTLIIDESHSIGIYGNNGSGLSNYHSLKPEIITFSMGKALGGSGGCIVCSDDVKDILINKARMLIYSVGIPPVIVDGIQEAISIVIKNNGALGERLLRKSKYLREKTSNIVELSNDFSNIMPIMTKDKDITNNLANYLNSRNIFVKAIHYPTVKKNSSRIRISVCDFLSYQDIDYFLNILSDFNKDSRIQGYTF